MTTTQSLASVKLFKEHPDFEKIRTTFFAIKRLHVELTHGDIRDGTECDSFYCPVALAISRALGKRLPQLPIILGRIPLNINARACVGTRAGLSVGHMHTTFSIPIRINQFIADFDKGCPVIKMQIMDNNYADDDEIFTTFYAYKGFKTFGRSRK